MLRYFLKRLLGMIPTVIFVTIAVFFFIHMLPGDPARLAAGPEADQETVEILDNPAAQAEGGAGLQAAQFLVDQQAEALITVRCGQNAAGEQGK